MKSFLASLAAIGNQLGVLVVIGVLSYAFFDQLFVRDLPCPLCLMQRMGFVLIGGAFALNIRSGAQASHYGLGIVCGLVGMMVSVRQILLHIAPHDAGYGATFFGLHFYTWAFAGYAALVALQAVLLMLPMQEVRSRSGFASACILVLMALVLANLVATLLECGIGRCADNPTTYEGWQWLRDSLFTPSS